MYEWRQMLVDSRKHGREAPHAPAGHGLTPAMVRQVEAGSTPFTKAEFRRVARELVNTLTPTEYKTLSAHHPRKQVCCAKHCSWWTCCGCKTRCCTVSRFWHLVTCCSHQFSRDRGANPILKPAWIKWTDTPPEPLPTQSYLMSAAIPALDAQTYLAAHDVRQFLQYDTERNATLRHAPRELPGPSQATVAAANRAIEAAFEEYWKDEKSRREREQNQRAIPMDEEQKDEERKARDFYVDEGWLRGRLVFGTDGVLGPVVEKHVDRITVAVQQNQKAQPGEHGTRNRGQSAFTHGMRPPGKTSWGGVASPSGPPASGLASPSSSSNQPTDTARSAQSPAAARGQPPAAAAHVEDQHAVDVADGSASSDDIELQGLPPQRPLVTRISSVTFHAPHAGGELQPTSRPPDDPDPPSRMAGRAQ